MMFYYVQSTSHFKEFNAIRKVFIFCGYWLVMDVFTFLRKEMKRHEHDSPDGRAVDYKLGGPEFKSLLWIQ